MKIKIFVPDIECESCVKVIGRRLKTLQGIDAFLIQQDGVELIYDEALIKPQNMVEMIQNAGFRASVNPFERKTLKERMRDFKENKRKYALERKGIAYGIAVLVVLITIEGLLYNAFFDTIPNFLVKYGPWILYLNIAVVALGMGVWHILSYKAKITCMVGMMIGMTIGMQSGLMLGAVMGAANGFFVGALIGMLTGVIVGGLMGKCCGIMGVMEGMMAGVMGGTMGPMIPLMMAADHILWFMPVFMLVNVIVIGGLSYVLFEEVVENRKDVTRRDIDFVTFASLCILITAILGAIIIYGPKSVLVL